MLLLILLIVLIVLAFGGGLGYADYRTPGIGLGALLVIVLLVMLLTGAIRV